MKYKKYSSYKDSGVDWLGEIPSDWNITRNKNIYKEINERSVTGNEDLLSVSEYFGVKPRHMVMSDGEHISRSESLIDYKKCSKDDLVMNIMLAWKRGLGVTIYDGIVSPAYSVFRSNSSVLPAFMHYLYRTDLYTANFKSKSTGVIDSRLRLYPESFGTVETILPSLQEQQQIASFLDKATHKIDTLISKQESLMALLKEKRQVVISHAVTRGLDPDVKLKDSGVEWLGKIPNHWNISKIKFHSKIKGRIGFRGYTKDDLVSQEEGALVIGASEMNNNAEIILNSPQYISWYKYYESPEIMLKEGDILLVQRGSTVGKVAHINYDLGHATINPSLVVIKEIKLNECFLKYYLMSNIIKSTVEIQTSNTAIPMISQEQIGNYILTIPPLDEQEKISSYLDDKTSKIDTLIDKATKSIELLKEKRAALISAAVTGKIDVREIA